MNDSENLHPMQLGGGPSRRSPSPIVQTPTRLRRFVKPAPRSCAATVRRANERRAKMHSSESETHSSGEHPRADHPATQDPPSLHPPNHVQGSSDDPNPLLDPPPADAPGSSVVTSISIATRDSEAFLDPPPADAPRSSAVTSVAIATRDREASRLPPPLRHPSPTYRQPLPPVGPRAPSAPPLASRPPSAVSVERSASGTSLRVLSNKGSRTGITVPPGPIVNIIPPTPAPAQPSANPPAHSNPPTTGSEDSEEQSGPPPPPPPFESSFDFPSEHSSENDSDLPQAVDFDPSSPPSTPTSGRRSGETNRILEQGYQELEAVLSRVAVQTRLTRQQVAEAWHKNSGRIINVPNHWNIYQSFFKVNEEAERARLGSPAAGPGAFILLEWDLSFWADTILY